MMRGGVLALVCGFTVPASAADIQPTFQATWDQVSANPDCSKTAERPDMVIFSCDKEMTLWYFTVPGTPAHPGVMKRMLVNKADGVFFEENARSFGPDDAQPAFKAWMAPILDLDRQARDYAAGHH
jgi:hypothetical protein